MIGCIVLEGCVCLPMVVFDGNQVIRKSLGKPDQVLAARISGKIAGQRAQLLQGQAARVRPSG